MSAARVQCCADAPAAARAAAAAIAMAATAAVRARGTFTLALSGGRTPALMLRALLDLDVPWPQVHVFQVDERVAPAGDAARNLNMIRDALVDPGRLAPGNLHPMPVEAAGDLAAAAARHALELQALAGAPPVLDLVHLGLGDDGHTASLVPGDAALAETARDVTVTAPYRGHRRMTFTFPIIDRARQRLWLATGADKAPMLARLVAGDRGIPAGRVRGADAVVFCDAPAAAELPRATA